MATTNYVWDPLNDSYLMETDDGGVTTAVHTQEPSHYGRLISQQRATDTSYFHQEKLGSTRLLTDESGTVTDSFIYDAWGNAVHRNGTTETSFQWIGSIGYHFDTHPGLHYIRARSYYTTIGSWIVVDSLIASTLRRTARYTYVANAPLSTEDPSGLIKETQQTRSIDAEIGNAEPCGLPITAHSRMLTLPVYEDNFTLDKDDDARVSQVYRYEGLSRGFIPRVVITVAATAGSCPGLTCKTVTPGQCVTLHSYSATFTFTETFTAGQAATDRHPVTFDPGWIKAINGKCKPLVTPCCNWTFAATKVKTLTYGYFPKRTPFTYNISKASSVTCNNMEPATLEPETWPSMPTAGGRNSDGIPDGKEFDDGIVFPRRYAISSLQSTTKYVISHDRCANGFKVTGTLSPYRIIALSRQNYNHS